MKLSTWALVPATLLACGAATADILWQDLSVSYLKGQNYRVGYPELQVYTLEHVAGTSWGDSFMFLDHSRSDNGARGNYGEWAPRFSLGKLSGNTMAFGVIKDVLVATQIEMSTLQTNYLYGVGVDFAFPLFKHSQLNLYRRQNENVDDSWQATFVWGLPFEMLGQEFLYDGFIDWASASSDQAAHMNFTSQLKWALHPLLGIKSRLYLGVEYAYWLNKYGIKDSPGFRTDESNLNLLVKWHF
ncbi:outer membrane protein OmpK [Rheinheimera sp.]|uniref:outer membrane protein OmpK n=1 Tax=Rheinheimera sp. TaxID=1869214 RepID=UPI0027B8EDB2|nr:outer membrane protein OmpK [Rheinheimera sp.]